MLIALPINDNFIAGIKKEQGPSGGKVNVEEYKVRATCWQAMHPIFYQALSGGDA